MLEVGCPFAVLVRTARSGKSRGHAGQSTAHEPRPATLTAAREKPNHTSFQKKEVLPETDHAHKFVISLLWSSVGIE